MLGFLDQLIEMVNKTTSKSDRTIYWPGVADPVFAQDLCTDGCGVAVERARCSERVAPEGWRVGQKNSLLCPADVQAINTSHAGLREISQVETKVCRPGVMFDG
jgi:hypothetical protein